MTDRILKADIDHMVPSLWTILQVVEHLNNITNHSQGFCIHKATRGYRLVRDGGWYMSPVLPKRGLYEWIWAYTAGIEDGQKLLTAK